MINWFFNHLTQLLWPYIAYNTQKLVAAEMQRYEKDRQQQFSVWMQENREATRLSLQHGIEALAYQRSMSESLEKLSAKAQSHA